MSIRIIKPGLQATIQDGGRNHYRYMGVGTGGAMDNFAFDVAGFLVGNEEEMPVLEINFPAPEILFEAGALISITGADLSPFAGNMPIPLWQPVLLAANTLLRFTQPLAGARAYIAVHRGWHADKWLNSYSTHLKLQAGGFKGRALQKDDVIEFENLPFVVEQTQVLPWHAPGSAIEKIYGSEKIICCIPGMEWNWLDTQVQHIFSQQQFTLSSQSDRMGYRFAGTPLQQADKKELISSATDAGTVQLLPDGNIIVLMADCQTTGGYPRIASVIKADLPRLAQLQPGEKIYFRMLTLPEAEAHWLQYQKLKQEIKTTSLERIKKYFRQ